MMRASPRSAAPRAERYLAHAVLATAFVMVAPAMLVHAVVPSAGLLMSLAVLAAAMALSLAAAALGSWVWMRRPGSRDLVFADLMLWGLLRRLRAERRLAGAQAVLDLSAEAGEADTAHGVERVQRLKRLGALLEARDAYTHGHSRRVTRHAERIAGAMGLPPVEVEKVATAAALHDIGKVRTPRAILNKPGGLTDEEFAAIKRHPVDGAEMLAQIGDHEIAKIVRHHHERLDGAGYPDGLAGEEIPIGARIIAVADTFDAMTSSRSYRGACSHKKALDVLAREAGAQLDAAAVAAFLGYYSGRRSVAVSALVGSLPQRVFAWLGGATQGLGSATAALVPLLPAVVAAAMLAATPGGPARAAELPKAAPRATAVVTNPSTAAGRGSRTNQARPLGGAGTSEQPVVGRAAPRGGGRAPTRAPVRGGRDAPSTGGPKAMPIDTAPALAPGSGEAQSATPAQEPKPTPTPSPNPVEVPQVALPEVELPKVEVPQVELPEVELPEVELPEVELPGVELPQLEVPDLELPLGGR